MDGGGFESTFGLPLCAATLGFEYSTHATGRDLRIGLGVDKQIGAFTLGAAYDSVTKDQQRTDCIFVQALLDVTPKDLLGIAFQTELSSSGTRPMSQALYTHYGPQEAWGTRLMVHYDTTGRDSQNGFGRCIIAQNPTLRRSSSTSWLSREIDGDFDVGFGNSAILELEPIRPGERTKGGFALDLSGGDKADTLSLTAWQFGMYGFMAFAYFFIFGYLFHQKLEPRSPEFWFMMQIAMLSGFLTSYPVNWWLLRRGIKERM